jgi:hypothetical protein
MKPANEGDDESRRSGSKRKTPDESSPGANTVGRPVNRFDDSLELQPSMPAQPAILAADQDRQKGTPTKQNNRPNSETNVAEGTRPKSTDFRSPADSDDASTESPSITSKTPSESTPSTETSANGQSTADSKSPANSSDPADVNQQVATKPAAATSESAMPEAGPAPQRQLAMAPQQSESGQNAETNRQRLRITERLSAGAVAAPNRLESDGNVRKKVVAINERLGDVELGLTRVINREIPDADRTKQFQNLDTLLGDVETMIANLRKETRDEQFAFVGLQMVDIGRSHVTPARERVFIAIREPQTIGDLNPRGALQQVIRARELLDSLLKRYDRVESERKLANALQEAVKFYEIYIEKTQQLLREAQQNRNPLERKMAVLELDQDYLDRYAEVLRLRRDMMAEFGRFLADDPRLLARYLELIKRRRTSLRDQLSERAEQQAEISTELNSWLSAGAGQQQDLWLLAVELRMQSSTLLAKDAAELSERIEKQLPLALEARQGSPLRIVDLGHQVAETARSISLAARRQIRQPANGADLRPQAESLAGMLEELDTRLDELGFQHEREADVTGYVTSRLLESRAVANQADEWVQIALHVHGRQFHRLVEVDQRRLAVATELLRVDMLSMESELNEQFQRVSEKSIPPEIAQLVQDLQRQMQLICIHQGAADYAMTQDRLPDARTLLAEVDAGFVRALELFDKIRRDVAAALDEFAPRNPNIADLRDPTLDEFLTQLEREPNIESQLGLPERPTNLRVIAETMMWQQTGGQMLGGAVAAANARAMKAEKESAAAVRRAEKPEEELTEEEREQRAQERQMEEDLTKALASVKERAKDPSQTDEERRKLARMAKEMQRSLDQKDRQTDETWDSLESSQAMKEAVKALANANNLPAEQWNKLISTLDDGLWQVGGRTLPEDYRKSIEQYQERIRKLTASETDE